MHGSNQFCSCISCRLGPKALWWMWDWNRWNYWIVSRAKEYKQKQSWETATKLKPIQLYPTNLRTHFFKPTSNSNNQLVLPLKSGSSNKTSISTTTCNHHPVSNLTNPRGTSRVQVSPKMSMSTVPPKSRGNWSAWKKPYPREPPKPDSTAPDIIAMDISRYLLKYKH